MTLEELLALGLSDEQAKGVMALKGKVVEAEQAKSKEALDKVTAERDTLSGELKDVKKDIDKFSKLSADNEELTAKLNEKSEALDAAEQARIAADTQHKFDTALSARAKELKLRNPDDLKRFLDLEKVTLKDDGTLDGLDDQVTNLKTNNSYLFEGDQRQGYNPAGGGTPAKPVSTLGGAIAAHYNGNS